MGAEAAAAFHEARAVFDAADAALGFAVSKLCFEGPEESLRQTENTQPAILTVSSALDAVLKKQCPRPYCVAGHSLGEYSALVAAGALALEDAVVLVRKRGRYMQQAVPVGEGAMAAVLGVTPEEIEALCAEASNGRIVEAANFNGAGQIVIAGHRDAVERASELARTKGKRAVALPVSAPFHCRLMEPAAAALREALAGVTFSDLRVSLFTNVDARPITRADEAREALIRQVASPVRWEESVRAMAAEGVTVFVEVGPGKVLSGLARKIVPGARVLSVSSPEDVDRFVREVELV